MRLTPCVCLSVFAIAFGAGCQSNKPPPVQLGEPVGAQVPARPTVPAFSVAFAVTKGQDPVPLLAPLVSTVSTAAASCPTLAADAKDDITPFEFKIAKGKMQVPARTSPAAAKCLSAALDGKPLGAEDGPALDARLELKITAPAKP